jgi:AraC-like DNA-binding protein
VAWPSTDCSNTVAAEAVTASALTQIDSLRLPNGSLVFCSFEAAVPPHAQGGDLVQIHLRRPAADAPGFEGHSTVWSVSRRVLVQKLAILSAQPVASDLQFDTVFSRDCRDCQHANLVFRLLDCLLAAAEDIRDAATDVLVAELEQALITAFLQASRDGWQQQLVAGSRGAAPWQVHRAETYIERNWHKPITIEDLAEETGASARSIFRAFRQSRGYTPLEFAKTVRLRHARRLLETESCGSVTEAAFACGFNDLGRFSRDFAQAFGERPSAVLIRRKSIA